MYSWDSSYDSYNTYDPYGTYDPYSTYDPYGTSNQWWGLSNYYYDPNGNYSY